VGVVVITAERSSSDGKEDLSAASRMLLARLHYVHPERKLGVSKKSGTAAPRFLRGETIVPRAGQFDTSPDWRDREKKEKKKARRKQ
jgi:hypothetical protein